DPGRHRFERDDAGLAHGGAETCLEHEVGAVGTDHALETHLADEAGFEKPGETGGLRPVGGDVEGELPAPAQHRDRYDAGEIGIVRRMGDDPAHGVPPLVGEGQKAPLSLELTACRGYGSKSPSPSTRRMHGFPTLLPHRMRGPRCDAG